MINFVVLMEKGGIARYYRRLDENEILFEIYKDGNLEVCHRLNAEFLPPEILFLLKNEEEKD